MSMTDQEWKDIRKDVNRGGLFGLGWVITILIIVALIGAASWGITVAVSGIKGQGDATIQKNSGTNRIVQDARFQQLYQEYKGSFAKIELAQQAVQADPKDRVAQTNLTGIQQHCVDIANEYNGLALSFIAQDFVGTNLPSTLDQASCVTTEGNN